MQSKIGLSLTVESITDDQMRQEIVRRRIAFDRNPQAFINRWTDSENILSRQLVKARTALPEVKIPEPMVDLAVRLSMEAGVQGHRLVRNAHHRSGSHGHIER